MFFLVLLVSSFFVFLPHVKADGEEYDYVDNNTSDVDSHSDHGTHSDFNTEKVFDATYDTLTEANTVTATNTTMLNDGFEAQNFNNWDGNGATTWTNDGGICTTGTNLEGWVSSPHSGTYYAGTGATGDGELETDTMDMSTATAIYISFWCAYDDTDAANELVVNLWDGAAYDLLDECVDPEVAEDTWCYYAVKISDSQYFDTTFRMQFVAACGSGEAVYVDDVIIIREVTPAANYELDLEIQWTNAAYTRQTELLCINAGTMNSEDIKVQVRNGGGAWNQVFADLTASQWNNISVSTYLTSGTFTVRFLGGTESSDTTLSTWQIECALLHTIAMQAYVTSLSQSITTSFSTFIQSSFNLGLTQGTVFGFTLNINRGMVLSLSQAVSSATAFLTKWDARITPMQSLTGSFNNQLIWNAIVGNTQTFTPSLSGLATWNTNVNPSQTISSTIDGNIQWDATTVFPQVLTTAISNNIGWEAIAGFSNSISTAFSNLISWILTITSPQSFTMTPNNSEKWDAKVISSGSISATLNKGMGWSANLSPSQSLLTSYNKAITWDASINPSQTISATLDIGIIQILGGTNYIVDLSNSFSITTNVFMKAVFHIENSISKVIQFIIDAFHTIISPATPVPENPSGPSVGASKIKPTICILSFFSGVEFDYLPVFQQYYHTTVTIKNDYGDNKVVTLFYWLELNSTKTQVWNSTTNIVVPALSTMRVTLTYPINQDGVYIANAQAVSPDAGKVFSNVFTANSQLFFMIGILGVFMFFMIIIGLVANMKKTGRKGFKFEAESEKE